MTELTRFGVSLPPTLIKAFDEEIAHRGYSSRSEAIRDMMRDYLVGGEWQNDEGQVAGTVTIVYDHDEHEVTEVLTDLQHHYCDAIACTTHVHMDEHHCLEVIVVRGPSTEVRLIADRLISTKGVKHGKLVCTTTGKALV